MHDPMLLECKAVALTCTFTRSFNNRKLLVYGFRPHHQTPVATVDELWHLAEAAWSSVPVHAILSLFDSMPKRTSPVIIVKGGCFWY
ncbi:hypothetical protein TNCV_4720051 [Trichonephila clavipes]|uniref:Uncharacterized protein n=1 Tax=Trichonephila clavipes TaxID=2585209 RepID=A0A8X6W5Z7_TRICX|nr:hypothetical protein TNCV_4720051 [Trichonephila clavipes]